MKVTRITGILLAASVLFTLFAAFKTQVVKAQQVCTDMTGMQVPCPDQGSDVRRKRTPKPPVPTATPTNTLAPTPTDTLQATATNTAVDTATATTAAAGAVVPPGDSAGSVPVTGGTSTSPFPGPLGMIIAVLIIVVCFGLLLPAIRKRLADGSDRMGAQPHMMGDGSVKISDGSDKMGAQPHMMGDGSNQFVKLGSKDGASQFQKADAPNNSKQE